MTIRKILNGKLVEMRPIPTGNKKDACQTCAMANEKAWCTTMDETCMDYPDENWHLVEENPPSTEIEGQKYCAAPRTVALNCVSCAAIPGQPLCEALMKLHLCDNRYWIKDENTKEGN